MTSSIQTARPPASQANIHSTAIIAPNAIIEPFVTIGPFTTIGNHVHIKKGTHIGPFVTIEGWTTIGNDCRIYSHAAIGFEAQDKKFANEKSFVQIGANTVIREFATIHRATGEQQATNIGNHCLLEAYSHVAHNCQLADHVTLAKAATLAGHVEVSEHAYIGQGAGIHQFVKIGHFASISAFTKAVQDIPPFISVCGNPARPLGVNPKWINRAIHSVAPSLINQAYELVYCHGLRLAQAIETIEATLPKIEELVCFTSFLSNATRGICRYHRPS